MAQSAAKAGKTSTEAAAPLTQIKCGYCKYERFVFIMTLTDPQPNPSLATMIVCVCRCVSDREIARHARGGMSFDDIQFELGVATQCGQCEGMAREVVAQCSACRPVAAIQHAASSGEGRAWTSQPSSQV
jgi:bacterioferritin-associated ferredoxin